MMMMMIVVVVTTTTITTTTTQIVLRILYAQAMNNEIKYNYNKLSYSTLQIYLYNALTLHCLIFEWSSHLTGKGANLSNKFVTVHVY